MKAGIQRAARVLFRRILATWPASFRRQFGENARETFRMRLAAAWREGWGSGFRTTARELGAACWLSLRWRLPDRPLDRAPVTRRGRREGEGFHRTPTHRSSAPRGRPHHDLARATGPTPASLRQPGSGTGLGLDLRVVRRRLARRPAFALSVLLTFVLGLGLTVSAFTVVHAVLLQPLPYPEPDRLVALWSTRDGEPTPFGNLSPPDVADYRSRLASLATVGGVNGPRQQALQTEGRAEPVSTARVTAGFFETLGVETSLGRVQPSPGEAVLAHGAWRDRFGADPAVLGRTLRLDGTVWRVAGVLEARAVADPWRDVDVWMPVGDTDASRGSRNLRVVGRLADGASPDRVREEVDALAAALAAAHPDSNAGIGARVLPLHELVVGPDAPRLLALLQAATLAVLLVACANVAGLYLVRAMDRRDEIALQRALGASTSRIVRPLLIEALLLAGAGSAVALGLAARLPGAIFGLLPTAVPRAGELRIGIEVVAFASGVALTAAVACVVVPALRTASRAPRPDLAGLSTASASRVRRRLGEALVVVQVGMAVTLLVGAGLLIRSLHELSSVDPGFDPRGVVVSDHLRLPASRYNSAAAVLSFQERALETLTSVPGVEVAAAVSVLPLSGGNLCDDVSLPGETPEPQCVEYRFSTPDYFRAMGISLLAGRAFTGADVGEAPRVAVVNRTFVDTVLDGADPLGTRISGRGREREIVGVVADVRHFGPASAPRPEVHLPFAQAPLPFFTLVARGGAGIAAPATRAVAALDPLLPVAGLRPLDSLVSAAVAMPRFRGVLLSAFGGVALLLAATGIAGVLSHAVLDRRRELGVRMALGAAAADVCALVLRRALAVTCAGVLLGIAGGISAGRLLQSFLFGVGAVDPWALLLAVATLGAAAFAATVVPLRRAVAVDPVEVLTSG